MKIYKEVVFKQEVLADIEEISNFIISKNTQISANRYIDALEAEINSLLFLADFIPKSQWQVINNFLGLFVCKQMDWLFLLELYLHLSDDGLCCCRDEVVAECSKFHG